jgi:hypothetical protein
MRHKQKHAPKYADRDTRDRKNSSETTQWRPSTRARFAPAGSTENWESSRGLIFARPFAEV